MTYGSLLVGAGPEDLEAHRLQFFDPDAGQRGSDKFYETWVLPLKSGEYRLIQRWGRVGTSGQEKCTDFPDLVSACDSRDRILDSKRKKGYRTTLHTLIEGAATWSAFRTSTHIEDLSQNTAEAEWVNQDKYGVSTIIEEEDALL